MSPFGMIFYGVEVSKDFIDETGLYSDKLFYFNTKESCYLGIIVETVELNEVIDLDQIDTENSETNFVNAVNLAFEEDEWGDDDFKQESYEFILNQERKTLFKVVFE